MNRAEEFGLSKSRLIKSKSRSRSGFKAGGAGHDNSYILNNITSLLSPANLKKIESKNLYRK
jgi:hypothetical protein